VEEYRMAALFKQTVGENLLKGFKRKDRYRILGCLKKGTIADFWSAFDNDLCRIVILKNLKNEFLNNLQTVRAFINETKLISYLDHPGITTIYDTFINDQGEPCYAMKMLDGAYLSEDMKLKSRGQLLSIFGKLCETLAHVHDKGVIHLGIRPDNIMIGLYGEVQILDWSCAKLYNPKPYCEFLKLVVDPPPAPIDDGDAQKVSLSAYTAPELTQDTPDALEPSSDIFSLGIILYQMMTGHVPFTASTPEELAMQIRTLVPPAMHQLNPEIPWKLAQICARMIEKDPFARYHGFHDVLLDLDRFQNSGQAFSISVYNAGDIIFREGEQGNYAFTVMSGQVEVSKNIDGVQTVLAILGKDEIVGELAIFAGQPRTATVRALESNTVIRVMDGENVEQELQKLSPWVGKMITGLSQRFINLNDQIVEINRKIHGK
jgi:serine/threonine-protein kinase